MHKNCESAYIRNLSPGTRGGLSTFELKRSDDKHSNDLSVLKLPKCSCTVEVKSNLISQESLSEQSVSNLKDSSTNDENVDSPKPTSSLLLLTIGVCLEFGPGPIRSK